VVQTVFSLRRRPAHVERALADRAVVAGAFRTYHVGDDGRRAPWLHFADLRSRYSRLPYGDQALFVRREAFERVGGFPTSRSWRTWNCRAG